MSARQPKHVPLATYRLQLHGEFPFASALEQIDYLDHLGVGDLYLSPVMRAQSGSGHGYDVTDPTEVNPDLGGMDGLRQLCASARDRGMGVLLDIVPNHMAATVENSSWERLLRGGPDAPEAAIFDVFWDAGGKIILPVLGDHYADALERDEFTVEGPAGDEKIVYFEHRLPVRDSDQSKTALARYREGTSGEQQQRALDDLIADQHYRLSYWRTGSRVINYRRFFDINELAATRVENDATFDLIHGALRPLIEDETITGLRIDHIDGLRDPEAYLHQLQRYLQADAHQPVYLVVEKILSGNEEMRSDWPVAGTTGYDMLNMVSGALSSTVGLTALVAMTGRYAAEERDFEELLYSAKHQVIQDLFNADITRLTDHLAAIARNDRYGRDLIQDELDDSIREVSVHLPVYRTYISTADIQRADRTLIEGAVSGAMERRPDLHAALRFLARVLLLQSGDLQQCIDFVASWQQFTGPVMAKGLEDTTLYRDPTLLSANAVGGERELAEVSVDDLHAWFQQRQDAWPLAMNATSTHDSKRSEDVRARIAVLSEIPDEWEAAFDQLREASAADVRSVDDLAVPDGRTALMLFQTMLGSWPLDESDRPGYVERIQTYAMKAVREAKLRTSWIDQNEVYEEALQGFISDLIENERFLEVFTTLQSQIATHGMINSLSATLIKMTAPGIPDFYQGTEIWDFSLVDPDNRRPVDYDRRRRLLDQIATDPGPAALLRDWQSGAIKLHVIQRTLQTRSALRSVFEQGSYVGIEVRGEHAGNVIAFARDLDGQWVVTIVPRLTARLARETGNPPGTIPTGSRSWGDTRVALPAGAPANFEQRLVAGSLSTANGEISVADALRDLPVSLLTGSE